MTPFEQYPHLFANGKFECTCKHAGEKTKGKIRGIKFNGHTYQFIVDRGIDGVYTEAVSDCTLIARRISDLTIEETYYVYFGLEQPQNDCLSEGGAEILQSDISKRIEKGVLDYETFLRLLEKGSYPGPQSHFEDGTVIEAQKETA